MKRGEVNDLGLGICAGPCKQWKELPSFHPGQKNKPRGQRARVCTSCYPKLKQQLDPFYLVNRSISAHKSMAGEGDYHLNDLIVLHQWQSFKCPYCNEPMHYDFTIEHIVPRAKGGRNLLSNILLICNTCNSSKQNFELIYWLENKLFRVMPKILYKIKGAYDEHGYSLSADCRHCTGSTNRNICSSNPSGPTKRCIKT